MYPLLFKTESLDIAIILEFWLAKPWWYIGSYTMLSKYGQFMHQFKTTEKQTDNFSSREREWHPKKIVLHVILLQH